MNQNLPSIRTAVSDREEHIEDIAERRGMTPEEYREHLRELDLEDGIDRMDLVDPADLNLP